MNDTIILKVKIINFLPVGWGVRYMAVNDEVVNGNANDMNDTIEFGILASSDNLYLSDGEKHIITLYNSKQINTESYLLGMNGTVSKLNEIWMISKIDSVPIMNEN